MFACIILVFCIVLFVFTSRVPCCEVRYDFRIKTMFGSSLPLVICRMSYLCYLCLFTFNGVQHILCCLFGLVVFVLCTQMLPVFLGCPFFVAPSVLSYVYVVPLRFHIGIHILYLGQT